MKQLLLTPRRNTVFRALTLNCARDKALLKVSLYIMNEWCFKPRFCTVRLYWTGDNLVEWGEFSLHTRSLIVRTIRYFPTTSVINICVSSAWPMFDRCSVLFGCNFFGTASVLVCISIAEFCALIRQVEAIVWWFVCLQDSVNNSSFIVITCIQNNWIKGCKSRERINHQTHLLKYIELRNNKRWHELDFHNFTILRIKDVEANFCRDRNRQFRFRYVIFLRL